MTPEEIRDRLEGGEICVVPYAHCDWAWTHTRAWHERRYVLAFEEVLQILRENPDFRWYLDSWITDLKPLLDRRTDLVPELQQRVREGKIAICGGYANVRPNMVGEETFLRNMVAGRRRFRALFPEADLSVHADIVDVSLGHPQMPQVLDLAGYRYYRAWRPQAALSVKGIPYEFVWEGLDGSRILVSRGCYGGLAAPDTVPENCTDDWDATVARLWERDLEVVARHSPTRLIWISQGMDDARPLRAWGGDAFIDLPRLLREWNRREKTPMRFATPVEFYRALEARREDVPVVSGTLDPCDVCYNAAWGGAHGLWRLRFQADHEVVAAETWSLLAGTGGEFAPLWENVFLCSAHATQWLFQEDFDDLVGLAQDTCRRARALRRQALAGISRRVPQVEHTAAVVLNPVPFARTVAVPVLLTDPIRLPGQVRLLDGSGRPVTSQVINDLAHGSHLWERQVMARVSLPPMGYTTLTWEPADAAPAAPAAGPDDVMDNRVVQLRFQGGHLRSVRSPQGEVAAPAGLAWSLLRAYDVDASAPLHVGEIRGTEDVQWQEARIVERGPVRWRHAAKGTIGPHAVTLETILFAGEARIEFRLAVEWRGADGFLACVWPMPFAGQTTGDVPFGAEGKDLEGEPWRTIPGHLSNNIERLREGMFYARSFVSVSDGKQGITHVSHDGDRYYLRDQERGTLAHLLINSVRPVREGWEKDVNVQREGVGRHTFTWSLLFHAGDWRAAGVMRESTSLRNPPEVLLPQGAPAPDLPAQRSFLSVEPANVLLSAFYAEEGAVILRVWESAGRPAEVEAHLPFAPLTAAAVDLNGEARPDPVPQLCGETLRFSLRPWQIATVRMVRSA